MRILLSLLLLWPSLSFAQLKLASGGPIEGESTITSQGITTKLEVNHWIKSSDELENPEGSTYEVRFKGGTVIRSEGPSKLQFLNETEVLLLKGCIRAELKEGFKVKQKDISLASSKKADAYICFNNDSLIGVSIYSDIGFYKDEELIGKIESEEFSVYSFLVSKLSQNEVLNKTQFYEIQKKPVPQGIKNLEKLVPAGLSGTVVENRNDILLEEMKQIDSSSSKLKFETSKPIQKGGSRVNFLTGAIIPPDYNAYHDSHLGLSFFTEKLKVDAPIKAVKRNYFYQTPIEDERITGGVRSIFDPQRFEEIK